MTLDPLRAPFPAFGGKRDVAADVWRAFGTPKQYIEPFCFSAAVLLAAPRPCSLEVISDINGFVANFWRATKHQPGEVANWADYPVSHVDLGARHAWLMGQRDRLGSELQDCDWPGDAKAAGFWLWGQCCWIGSGWAEWNKPAGGQDSARLGCREGHSSGGTDSDAGNAGMGIQAAGQIPHASDAGMGIQAAGQIPHAGNAGMGIQAAGQIPHASDAGMGDPSVLWTSSGRVAWAWLHRLAERLERVRIVHGEWYRCLNHHYGGLDTAVFLDPPYRSYESLYASEDVADAVEAWARGNSKIRVALCGHVGDYNLPDWTEWRWKRKRLTYSGDSTTDRECIWFSPACLPVDVQPTLFNRTEVTP